MRNLLADLELVHHVSRHDVDEEADIADDPLDRLRDMLRDEEESRRTFGRAYEAMLKLAFRDAQEWLLGLGALTARDVGLLYDAHADISGSAKFFEKMHVASGLRITLSELPQQSGSSNTWKREIAKKLRDFKDRYGWAIDPVQVPIALVVIVKPPPPSRNLGLHDLDNIARSYLVPEVLKVVKPISDFTFLLDEDPEFDRFIRRPPPITKVGITRYELWRLPPAEEHDTGFVSLSVIADMTRYQDIFSEIDDVIDRWAEEVE